MNGWNTGMGWGFGGVFFAIILLIGVIVGIIFLVRWLINKNGSEMPQNSQEILKNRYARGEISREEYLQLKSDLEEEAYHEN